MGTIYVIYITARVHMHELHWQNTGGTKEMLAAAEFIHTEFFTDESHQFSIFILPSFSISIVVLSVPAAFSALTLMTGQHEGQWACKIILVARRISLTSCNTISPQGLHAHPLLISYLFRDITYHLDPVLFASQPDGSGTPCLSAFMKPSHFLFSNAILKLTFSGQLTPPLATHHQTRPDSSTDFGAI